MPLVSTDAPAWTPDRIKALRRRLRLRQDEFAHLLGYGDRRQSVSDLERGETKPTGTVTVLLDLIDQFDGLPSRQRES